MPHLACRVFGTPLLIARPKLDVILSVLAPRLGMEAQASLPMPLEGSLPPRASPPGSDHAPGIAVIPVHGTLMRRTLGLDALSGLTSYAGVAALLDEAVADPRVEGIVLDVDSPGGEAAGVFELARRVRAAGDAKPVWAVANDSAFSAAYAIAASAERLFVTETGGAGSIGVIALHVDQSARDVREGLRYTAITAGRHKNDYSPHAPLTPDAQASLQAEVDRLQALFVDHVASMRGLDPDMVRAQEAALFFGEHAVAAGLADGMRSLEAALTDFHAHLATSRSRNPTRASRPGFSTARQDLVPMPDTTTSPPSSDQTVDPTAALLAQARQEAARGAQAIAELCQIAGCPERAVEFIAAGRSEAEVRRALIEARAAASDATTTSSTIAVDAGAPTAPAASPVVAAVKKLHAKE